MELTPTTSSPIYIIDIDAATTGLESEPEKNINAQRLYKSVGMEIMLITLHAQAELKKHSAPGPISVQVLKGSISFRTDEAAYDLKSGQLLTLEANLPHSVYAHERSVFLVTKNIPEQQPAL